MKVDDGATAAAHVDDRLHAIDVEFLACEPLRRFHCATRYFRHLNPLPHAPLPKRPSIAGRLEKSTSSPGGQEERLGRRAAREVLRRALRRCPRDREQVRDTSSLPADHAPAQRVAHCWQAPAPCATRPPCP